MELSLCMIVKNEEENLARCLESVAGVMDEIVIMDTGSTDGTREVARRFTDKVFEFRWIDDFAAARNAAMDRATKPFVMWLDADDVLDEAGAERLAALKARLDENVDAVMLPYQYAFSGDGKPSLVFERERIVRRAAGFRFVGAVHEAMAVSGNILHEDIPVIHTRTHRANGRRNLDIYEKWIARGQALSPRDRYYYARELMDCGEIRRAERAFSDFLSMEGGWLPNRRDAQVQRGICLEKLGRPEEAQCAYLMALGCGKPDAQALCALGGLSMNKMDWAAAEFWYRAALLAEPDSASGAFVQPAYHGYVPLMQLCVCLDKQGRHAEAAQMNARALALRPGDAAARQNREYFARMGIVPEESAKGEGRT